MPRLRVRELGRGLLRGSYSCSRRHCIRLSYQLEQEGQRLTLGTSHGCCMTALAMLPCVLETLIISKSPASLESWPYLGCHQ